MSESHALAERTYAALPAEIRTPAVRAELAQVSGSGEMEAWIQEAIAYCRAKGSTAQATALAQILSSLQPNPGGTAVNVFDFSQTTIIGGNQEIASHNSHDESRREQRTVRIPVPRIEQTDIMPYAAVAAFLGVCLGMTIAMLHTVNAPPRPDTPQEIVP